MYLTAKKDGTPITIEQLREAGKISHGRPVWEVTSSGLVEKIFDLSTSSLMLPVEFGELQRQRAETRRASYPKGWRERRGRNSHSFAPQDIGGIYSR